MKTNNNKIEIQTATGAGYGCQPGFTLV